MGQGQVPGLRRLSAAAATSARDVWMVGTNSSGTAVILHWDGERWTRARRPNAELLGLASSLPPMCGRSVTPPRAASRLHWDGSHWASYTQRAPNGGYGPDESPELTSVVESGSRDIWAAGDAGNSGEPDDPDTVLFHWDGTRSQKAVPAPRGWI